VQETRIKILLIEDDRVDQMAFERFVRKESLPYEYAGAGSVAEGKALLETEAFDAIVTDFALGDGTAFDLFECIPDDTPIVVVTGGGDEETAVQAMKAGASDYLIKDSDGRYLTILPVTVSNAIKAKKSDKALQKARDELESRVEERTAELKRVNEKLVLEIAERKKAEEKYRSIFENAVEGLFQTTPDGRFVNANPAAARILGYHSPEELISQVSDVGHQVYVKIESRERFIALMRDHKPVPTFETRMFRKDGSTIWVSIHARAIYDEQGELMLVEGILEDISERKNAEAALLDSQDRFFRLYRESKRSEELYRSLLDSTPDAVVVYDMDGRVKYVNESFSSTFGWTRDEVLGMRIDYIPDEERAGSMKSIRNVLEHEGPNRGFETKRYTKDGRVLDVSISGSRYLDHEGNPAGLLVVLSDITEQKQLHDQLRQASKMEAIGQLAGGVAHDFNNLLTAMMGYSNLLLQRVPKDADYREQILQISKASERATSLTKQLLAFGRKQMLELKVINPNDAIHEFVKILRRLIGENIDLVTRLDESLASVRADPSQVEQILMNMAVNARDAMTRGGCLTIETANVMLDHEYARTRPEVKPGPYVRIAISDNGCGMDGETVNRIFDPFFTTKEKGVGTGLGLSTVYGIVKQHQGHVAVYSEPGRGTTFKIYLPTSDEPKQTILESSVVRFERHGTETVLLVEDEEIVRNLASEVLEMLGYRVLSASGPEEAIETSRAYRARIDLLLTDVVLPKMDGKSLFTLLNLERPRMKVLYVSGYTESFIVQHGVLMPGVNFLQKPFTVNSLSAKVRDVLDRPPLIPHSDIAGD
jgi:two-component system cell cycle sensor histidine kinase/response regulator CckA